MFREFNTLDPAQEITVSGKGVTRQLHGLLRNQAALDLEH